jgi:hypothetical protein
MERIALQDKKQQGVRSQGNIHILGRFNGCGYRVEASQTQEFLLDHKNLSKRNSLRLYLSIEDNLQISNSSALYPIILIEVHQYYKHLLR